MHSKCTTKIYFSNKIKEMRHRWKKIGERGCASGRRRRWRKKKLRADKSFNMSMGGEADIQGGAGRSGPT